MIKQLNYILLTGFALFIPAQAALAASPSKVEKLANAKVALPAYTYIIGQDEVVYPTKEASTPTSVKKNTPHKRKLQNK